MIYISLKSHMHISYMHHILTQTCTIITYIIYTHTSHACVVLLYCTWFGFRLQWNGRSKGQVGCALLMVLGARVTKRCDSGSKTVLVRIGFFFLNAVIKTASKTYFFSL